MGTDRILRKSASQYPPAVVPLGAAAPRTTGPSLATFSCTVNMIDEPYRDRISREIYERRKAEVGDGIAPINVEDSDDESS